VAELRPAPDAPIAASTSSKVMKTVSKSSMSSSGITPFSTAIRPYADTLLPTRCDTTNYKGESLSVDVPYSNDYGSTDHHKTKFSTQLQRQQQQRRVEARDSLTSRTLALLRASVAPQPQAPLESYLSPIHQRRIRSPITSAPTATRQIVSTRSKSTRCLSDSNYKTEICRKFQQSGLCEYGSSCQFAHGLHEVRRPLSFGMKTPPPQTMSADAIADTLELLRLPSSGRTPLILHDINQEAPPRKRLPCDLRLYKTEICRTYSQYEMCPYEHKCRFAHGLGELRSRPRFASGTPGVPNSDHDRELSRMEMQKRISPFNAIGPPSSSDMSMRMFAPLRVSISPLMQ